MPKFSLPKIEKPDIHLPIPKLSLGSLQKMSRKEKMHMVGYAVLLPAAILMFVYGTFTNSTQPDHPQKPAATQQQKQKPAETPQIAAGGARQNPSLLATNPFVDASTLATAGGNNPQNHAAPNRTMLPTIPAQQPSSPSYTPRPNVTTSLPAISNTRVPAPVAPRPSNMMPGAAPSAESHPTVSGVLTSEDGNNMAIMSDGRVVSEGDNYNGDRIAYIGGDGIQFDNGHTIGYK